jgi:hypothetical protein
MRGKAIAKQSFKPHDRVLYEGDIFKVVSADRKLVGLKQLTFDNRHPSDDFMFSDPRNSVVNTLMMLSPASLAKHQVPWVLRCSHATPIL